MSSHDQTNHLDDVRNWLRKQELSEDRAAALLDGYRDQHESPFAESNRIFLLSLVAAGVFYLKFYKVEFSVEIFEVDLIGIPNALFVLPFVSLLALAYSAVRAADAAYYQKLIEIIAEECFDDSKKVFSRAYFGGGILSSNFLDVWSAIPNKGFRWLFVALSSTSGLVLIATVLLPFASGLTFIFGVSISTEASLLNPELVLMVSAEIVAIVAGLYALAATQLEEEPRN